MKAKQLVISPIRILLPVCLAVTALVTSCEKSPSNRLNLQTAESNKSNSLTPEPSKPTISTNLTQPSPVEPSPKPSPSLEITPYRQGRSASAASVNRVWNHAQITAMFKLMLQSEGRGILSSVFCRTLTDIRTNIAQVECEISRIGSDTIHSFKFNLSPRKEVLDGYTMKKTGRPDYELRIIDVDTDGMPEAISITRNNTIICESLGERACLLNYTSLFVSVNERIQESLPPWYDRYTTELLISRLKYSKDDRVVRLKPSDTGTEEYLYVLRFERYSLIIKVKQSGILDSPVALKMELKTESPTEQSLLSVEDEDFDGFPERVSAAEEWTGTEKLSYYHKSTYGRPLPASELAGRIAVNTLFGMIEKLHIRW
jgi:hypothetical protein